VEKSRTKKQELMRGQDEKSIHRHKGDLLNPLSLCEEESISGNWYPDRGLVWFWLEPNRPPVLATAASLSAPLPVNNFKISRIAILPRSTLDPLWISSHLLLSGNDVRCRGRCPMFGVLQATKVFEAEKRSSQPHAHKLIQSGCRLPNLISFVSG
jgi:hypothetical protein